MGTDHFISINDWGKYPLCGRLDIPKDMFIPFDVLFPAICGTLGIANRANVVSNITDARNSPIKNYKLSTAELNEYRRA